MDQQGDHGELHFAGFDLLAEVFGRPPDHQARDEHADNQVDQHVDHAHPFAAEDAVQPHARQGRDSRQRIEAVVHAVHRPAGDAGRRGGKGRSGRRAEPQFLALQVAQRLIDGQRGSETRAGFVGPVLLAGSRSTNSAGLPLRAMTHLCCTVPSGWGKSCG